MPVGGTLNSLSGAQRKNRWPRRHSYSRPTKSRNTTSTTSRRHRIKHSKQHRWNHVALKVAHTRLQSAGFCSRSRFLAVSLQVTWVINLAVGCHYFPPGPQLPLQPLRGLLPISLLGEQRQDGCEQFVQDLLPNSVATEIWTQALLHLSPAC